MLHVLYYCEGCGSLSRVRLFAQWRLKRQVLSGITLTSRSSAHALLGSAVWARALIFLKFFFSWISSCIRALGLLGGRGRPSQSPPINRRWDETERSAVNCVTLDDCYSVASAHVFFLRQVWFWSKLVYYRCYNDLYKFDTFWHYIFLYNNLRFIETLKNFL